MYAKLSQFPGSSIELARFEQPSLGARGHLDRGHAHVYHWHGGKERVRRLSGPGLVLERLLGLNNHNRLFAECLPVVMMRAGVEQRVEKEQTQ